MKIMHRCNHAEIWSDVVSISPSSYITFSQGDYTEHYYMQIAMFNNKTIDIIVSVTDLYKICDFK